MLNIIIQMIDEPKKLPIDMKDRRSINCQDSLGGFHSFPPRSRLYICKHSSILFIQKKKKKKAILINTLISLQAEPLILKIWPSRSSFLVYVPPQRASVTPRADAHVSRVLKLQKHG
jgi:hypothetical protein